jgi:hypothetical protein
VVHLSQSTQGSATNRPTITPYHPFTRIAMEGRVVREYGGFLPCSNLTVRHILRCEHLRDILGEDVPPHRMEPEFTHQIWIWYRPLTDPDQLHFVYRGQFDFTVPDYDVDAVAAKVTDSLAEVLWDCTNLEQILRHEDSDIFWSRSVESSLQLLSPS